MPGATGSSTGPVAHDLNHGVYSRLLELLTLTDRHRQDLRGRGLSDDQIDRRGYRSLEKFAARQAIGKLKEQFDEDDPARVPGFRMPATGRSSSSTPKACWCR